MTQEGRTRLWFVIGLTAGFLRLALAVTGLPPRRAGARKAWERAVELGILLEWGGRQVLEPVARRMFAGDLHKKTYTP